MNKSYMIGYRFQIRVKKHLESKGYMCIVQPRSAFPDIVAWRSEFSGFDILLVECKVNKYLSKEEKQRMIDLIESERCSSFLVAYRKKRKMKFQEYNDLNGKFYEVLITTKDGVYPIFKEDKNEKTKPNR